MIHNLKNILEKLVEIKVSFKKHSPDYIRRRNITFYSRKLRFTSRYCIFSNKRWASNKRRSLIRAALLGIHIEISASPLIDAALLNTVLIRIVTIFYQ